MSDKETNFIGHLTELRQRLINSLIFLSASNFSSVEVCKLSITPPTPLTSSAAPPENNLLIIVVFF